MTGIIGIIDYDAGNLGSVRKALDYLDVEYRVIASGAEWGDPSVIILPGVGAFGPAAGKLKERGFFGLIKEHIAAGRPFLGICLGMQLLMESSEEAPGVEGLGVIKGACRKFQQGKVPQIGWNKTYTKTGSALFEDIPGGSSFYFIHSYYVTEEDPGAAAASTHYYIPFTSVFEKDNVCAVQFHPEKSGETGLRLLSNWIEMIRSSAPRIRIIPCLDVDNGRVVKGVNFKNPRDAGDPVELAGRYNREGADEITFLDIGATYKSREILMDVVERVSREVFVPLCVGGGIRTAADMRGVLKAGADKVSTCSAAIREPSLITEGARRFGSQCIVLSIDAGRVGDSWHAFANGGRVDSGIDALEWAKKGEALGAGEILLNSIDRDGAQEGYDLELTRKVSETVNIPVIASGGAGTLEHMVEAAVTGKADAILLASLLHDQQLSLQDIKTYLNKKGVNVRW
jgi:imidazole glycerol phosphate synthase glutamine amidotransferase subunit